MNVLDYAYIPIVALLNLGIVYGWNKKFKKNLILTKKDWLFIYICSFLNVWGLDTLQHALISNKFLDAMKVSLGAWLLFTGASAFKTGRFRSMPLNEFWIDYGGELICYFFMGAGIFVLT